MTETRVNDDDKIAPHDLVPGQAYRVHFDDCCVAGHFDGVFMEIRGPGYSDGSGNPETDFDALVFDTGEITMDWGQWWVTARNQT